MAKKKKTTKKKPKGWNAFNKIAKAIAQVPKEEVEQAEAKREKRKSRE